MSLRIQRLTLTDFRAFPGPAPTDFDLNGHNLLVYGENGTGKSSLFHALKEFFALKPGRPLPYYRNVFSGAPDNAVCVDVTFNDGGSAARWMLQGSPLIERHPAQSSSGSDLRITQAALRRACLDYRALLDTNYIHGDSTVNLFDIALNHLVPDYSVPASGGIPRTIAELWRAAEQSKPLRHNTMALSRINQACAEFNGGFNQALAALHPHISTLLSDLLGTEVVVAPFVFAGVTYNAAFFRRDREITGRTLVPEISFYAHRLQTPQHFLNEARLSALALAIYLAGRLACTPPATPNVLKLLVLDDVLIGLDHSNRLPVLDVLHRHFSDWQVVLLTHDRVWFEMARFYVGPTNRWKCVEVLETKDVRRGISAPTVRATGDRAGEANLEQARQFLIDHHEPAAANYTRAAFEWGLKLFCDRFRVPVGFKIDPRHVDTGTLLSSVERWLNERGARSIFAPVIERVKMFRTVVLNPYSHAAPPTIARAEIEGAIAAVAAILELLDPQVVASPFLLPTVRQLLSPSVPPAIKLHAALAYLRVAFHESLVAYSERKNVTVPSRRKPLSTKALWTAAKADPIRPIPPHVVSKVEPQHAGLLIDDISDGTLASITKMAVESALNDIVAPGDPDRCELDAL